MLPQGGEGADERLKEICRSCSCDCQSLGNTDGCRGGWLSSSDMPLGCRRPARSELHEVSTRACMHVQ